MAISRFALPRSKPERQGFFMMKGLLVLAVFLLCLFGLANLIWAVMLWLTRGRHSRKPTMVLLLPHHCADIEPALRSAVFEAESMGIQPMQRHSGRG